VTIPHFQDNPMPKAPNYQFERRERDRLKAIKLAEKAAERREQQDRVLDADAPPDRSSSDPNNT
jgi:hypothetical protein